MVSKKNQKKVTKKKPTSGTTPEKTIDQKKASTIIFGTIGVLGIIYFVVAYILLIRTGKKPSDTSLEPQQAIYSQSGDNVNSEEIYASSIQTGTTQETGQQSGFSFSQICNETMCWTIEIADTAELQAKGLMYRETLADDAGMLFVFPQEAPYAFWMKNTLIPLDIVWMDSSYMVVDITTMVPCTEDPCPRYSPQESGKYVLEINAGGAEKYDIKIGDTMLLQK